MTDDLFRDADTRSDEFVSIDMPDADVLLYATLFSEKEACQLFTMLRREIHWQQQDIKLYGKTHTVPRLTAWYGEPGTRYRYSGVTVEAIPWIPPLLAIRKRIERVSDVAFNSVLLNLYRSGSDSMAWHADDEPELGRNPVIGSVSLGQPRDFRMKHKRDASARQSIALANGSYLLMRGAMQHHWVHQIAKSRRPLGERINLTYRQIL